MWCEHEHVTRIPPDCKRRNARRLTSLYPRAAFSSADRVLVNAGGSTTTTSNIRRAVTRLGRYSSTFASINRAFVILLAVAFQWAISSAGPELSTASTDSQALARWSAN